MFVNGSATGVKAGNGSDVFGRGDVSIWAAEMPGVRAAGKPGGRAAEEPEERAAEVA